MAVQKNSYNGATPAQNPAGTQTVKRIRDGIIIDTVVGGIAGGGTEKNDLSALFLYRASPSGKQGIAIAAAGSSTYVQITQNRNVTILNSLPPGVTLMETYDQNNNNWSVSQVGIIDDEVFYVSYNGAKIKNNKIFPYEGYKLVQATDFVCLEIDFSTNTAKIYGT